MQDLSRCSALAMFLHVKHARNRTYLYVVAL